MKNFANVSRWEKVDDVADGEVLSYMDIRSKGSYVFYSDYEELLNTYRTLIDKMSEVIGNAAFDQWG